MVTVDEVVKKLVEIGLCGVTLRYDREEDMHYWDLNTEAKSHLHLYEDGLARMRYNESKLLDLNKSSYEVISDLYSLFSECLWGRDYYNASWEAVEQFLGK